MEVLPGILLFSLKMSYSWVLPSRNYPLLSVFILQLSLIECNLQYSSTKGIKKKSGGTGTEHKRNISIFRLGCINELLKILDLVAHIRAQDHLMWCTMLRLRLPKFVYLFKIGLSPPTFPYALTWKRYCALILPHVVNFKHAEQGFNPLDSLGWKHMYTFWKSAITLENLCMVADFPRYAPLCTLENGKTFPA